jgi:catechol 2,3-dioxygenase-like lactoylglutathione lyase family enzyme
MTAHLQNVHPVLMARDVAVSVQFYSALGFALSFVDQPGDSKYAGVVRDGVELHIQWAGSEQWAYPTDRPAYRFIVSDVDALYREFAESGCINPDTIQGSPWAVPANTPWGTREFHIRDPGQNSLQFYQPL